MKNPATRYVHLLIASFFLLLIPAATGWAQSITLSVPATVTIHPGDQNVPVTVAVANSTYSGPIPITISGLPSGVTVSPLTLTANTSGTLYLSATVAAGQELFNPADIEGNGVEYATPSVVAVTGVTTTTKAFTLAVAIMNPAFAPAPGALNLPIVNINTNGVAIVDKTTDVPGTITITSANGQTSYLPNSSDTDNTATFHLHGNTTVIMPKKPYHVKLNTSLDVLTAMGLHCPYVNSKGKSVCDKSKSYVLLANYDDKTFLRDWSASALANAIPIGGAYLNSPANSPTPSGTSKLMPWAPHSLFVELYLNGVYQGNYQLIEEVKVDGNRININELQETDTTDDITGGYLVEIDERQDEDFVWTTPQGVPLGLIDPDYTPEVPEQTSYIDNYTVTAENALFSSTFTDPVLGWRPYWDDASAVNFYIVNDLMGNGDGGDMFSSDYFYKSQDNPLLYMGPIWDFDISSGNDNYQTIENPTSSWMQTHAIWYEQWFKDPSFLADVTSQWNALKTNGVFSTWLASIPAEAATLEQSAANNFGRWPMQGLEVWPNPIAFGTYDGEVAYLTNWLTVRLGYLDSEFNKKTPTATAITVPSGTFRTGSPVTLQASVTGGTGPTGSVAFLSNNVVLGLSPIGGSGTASFTGSLPAGTDALQAVYVGDNTNALSVSSATSTTVLPAFVSTATTLAASPTTVAPGTAVTLSTVVVPNSGTSIPTGMVSFTANGAPLGSVPVGSGGTATYSPSSLPTGTYIIQAAYGGDVNFQTSTSNTVSVAVTPVGTLVFSLPPGSYVGPQTVFISGASAGASIYYTLDGTTPTTSSTKYTLPVAITASETLTAIAIETGFPSSATTSAAYTINPPVVPINFSGGFAESAGDIQLNGTAVLAGSALQLTNTVPNAAGSAFFTTPVNVQAFTTDFTFLLTNAAADGFTFAIQSGSPTALGGAGAGLGYVTMQNSVAIKFDLYNNSGEGSDSTDLYTWGNTPTLPSIDLTNTGINLHSGDSMAVHITYDGTVLNMTITDQVTHASWSNAFVVNIPAKVFGPTAYVGFTGSTGGLTANQEITSWTYVPGPPVVPNYPAGIYPTGLVLNGTAALSGTTLQLTNGGLNQAGSVFFADPVNVQAFTNNFTFQILNPVADGFTFTLQNSGPNALGGHGAGLGFVNIQTSLAIKFDLFNNAGEGPDSTGLFRNGNTPSEPGAVDMSGTGIDLHSGDFINARMTYDGTTLTMTLTDLQTSATWTYAWTENIPLLIHANTAYVGFTGGTGGETSTQTITNWVYTPGPPI